MNIRESLDLILSDARHEFSSRFYKNLFAHHPDIIHKFDGIDLKYQGAMVVMALQVISDHHRRPLPAMQNYLRVLGHKHHMKGIRLDDYLHFETSLLTTLGAYHGPAWSPDLASQWKSAFQQAVQLMAEGHAENFSVR